MKTWRLIIDAVPLRGSLNMAVDEFLFRGASQGKGTSLRFYQWDKPTVSISYGQEAERTVDLACCRAQGIPVVRRMTGGKVVLHGREATYSLASSDTETFSATLRDSYRLISLALVRGLSDLGLSARLSPAPPLPYLRELMPCFAFPARDEVEIAGRKIVGSAQKRSGAAFLQHGSIPLETDETLLKAVARSDRDDEIRMTSLSEALGRPIAFTEAASRLAQGFSATFGITLSPYHFTREDWQTIFSIESRRYGNEAWTFRSPCESLENMEKLQKIT
jgi:lipoate-protein ligase A